MGSKNRIFLGLVSHHILHKIRNTFEKKVYITDATLKKVKNKHFPLNKQFIENGKFQSIIDNTLMIYYDDKKKMYNCLSRVDESFFIYGMASKNKRTEISTLFKTNQNQIKKKFTENKNLIVLKEEFTTN